MDRYENTEKSQCNPLGLERTSDFFMLPHRYTESCFFAAIGKGNDALAFAHGGNRALIGGRLAVRLGLGERRYIADVPTAGHSLYPVSRGLIWSKLRVRCRDRELLQLRCNLNRDFKGAITVHADDFVVPSFSPFTLAPAVWRFARFRMSMPPCQQATPFTVGIGADHFDGFGGSCPITREVGCTSMLAKLSWKTTGSDTPFPP